MEFQNLNHSVESSVTRSRERGLGPGRAFRDWVGWILELGAKDERSGPGFESNRPSLSSQGKARNQANVRSSISQEVGLAAPPTWSGF
ncbi:hypothetical protein Tco_1489822 [Tanacetum coccineum]